jgi:hypothetical protein
MSAVWECAIFGRTENVSETLGWECLVVSIRSETSVDVNEKRKVLVQRADILFVQNREPVPRPKHVGFEEQSSR